MDQITIYIKKLAQRYLFFICVLMVSQLQFYSVTSFAQSVQVIDKKFPSVYLAFENRNEDKDTKNSRQHFFVLRLHNNTSVNINVGANFDLGLASTIEDGKFQLGDLGNGTFLKEGSLVELCYDAEGLFIFQGDSIPKKVKNPVVKDFRNSCFLRSNGKSIDEPHSIGYWIRSNEFVRFKLPASLLDKNLKAFTEFSFPWEFENGRLTRNQPKHRAYFYYFDLPDDLP